MFNYIETKKEIISMTSGDLDLEHKVIGYLSGHAPVYKATYPQI